MTYAELLALILGVPIAVYLGAIAGRLAQRSLWLLHRPYDERLKSVRDKRA